VKIIQTKKFIASSDSGGPNGDYESQKSIWGPKENGPIELFREKSDSEDDIKKRWKKKQKPVKVKRPYQLDGVPGSTT
jgi:hypothetical protein